MTRESFTSCGNDDVMRVLLRMRGQYSNILLLKWQMERKSLRTQLDAELQCQPPVARLGGNRGRTSPVAKSSKVDVPDVTEHTDLSVEFVVLKIWKTIDTFTNQIGTFMNNDDKNNILLHDEIFTDADQTDNVLMTSNVNPCKKTHVFWKSAKRLIYIPLELLQRPQQVAVYGLNQRHWLFLVPKTSFGNYRLSERARRLRLKCRWRWRSVLGCGHP